MSKIRFIRLYQLTIFSIITNLRENRLFASEWTVDEKKRAHSVKFCTKYFTTQRIYSHVNPKQNLKNKSAYMQYDTAAPILRARMSNTAICLSYVQIRKSLENGQTTSLQAFISPLNACAVAPASITRLPYCVQQPT